MTYGDFSPSGDPEDEAFRCYRDVIYFHPVRYSLQPFGRPADAAKPSSIGAPGDYIVRTLRRGFVYVYIERPEETEGATSRDGLWYVFRRTTSPADVNAAYVPDGTEHLETSGGFAKYEFTDNYGEGAWSFEGVPGRNCWVPSWASRIWVAYSEFRWPPAFFRRGHDAGFRAQLMTEVDLRGSNRHAATIGEAADLVEEWKGSSELVVQNRLNLSQTGFQRTPPASWPQPVTPENADCVAVVALADPLGDIREMGYRMEQVDDHMKSFHAAHVFPLTIGQFCEKLAPNIPARDGWADDVHFLWTDWQITNGPALQPGWKLSYDGLVDIVEQMRRTLGELVRGIKTHMNDAAPHMLGRNLDLAWAEADAGDAQALEYWTILFGTAMAQLSTVAPGSAAVSQGLGEDIESPGPPLRTLINNFRKGWGRIVRKEVRDRVPKQYAFRVAFEAIAVELGASFAQGTQGLATWEDALLAGMTQGEAGSLTISTRTMSLDQAIDFLEGSQAGLRPGGLTPATALEGVIENGGGVVSQVVRGPTVEMPFIATQAGVTLDAGSLGNARRMAGGEVAWQGAGLLLATWSLHEAATKHALRDGMFESGAITDLTHSRTFQVGAAAIGMAEALRTMGTAAQGLSRNAITGAAVTALYEGAIERNAATLVRVASTPATGNVGRLVSKFLPRVAMFAGAALGAAAAWRAHERQDRSATLGNIAMVIGGLLLVPGVGLGAAVIGGIILAVGFLMTLQSYSQVEDVARTSFYGTTRDHHRNPRQAIPALIETTRNLPAPWDEAFEKEVAAFGELTWKPVIEQGAAGDGFVVVRSPALAADPSAVRVRVQKRNPRGQGPRFHGVGYAVDPVPGAGALRVRIPNVRHSVRVTATVIGPLTGIEHTTTAEFADP